MGEKMSLQDVRDWLLSRAQTPEGISSEGCANAAKWITAHLTQPAQAVDVLDAEDLAVLRRLRDALPDVGLNGWHRGVTVLNKLLTASIPQPNDTDTPDAAR